MSRAVVALRGQVNVSPVPVGELGPHEVRVRIGYAGICGSDLHTVDEAVAPVVPGHEQSGTVVEVGSAVTGWAAGRRAVVLPRVRCGTCAPCRRGVAHRCRSWRRPRAGGWAESMDVDAAFLLPVPDGLGLREAALAEPLACVLHAIDRAELRAGATALVIGAGSMGLLLAALLPRCGASTVLVSEPNPQRRSSALRLGARAVDPRSVDLAAWVADATGGAGVDVIFEASGVPAALEQALDLPGDETTVVIVGVAPAAAVVPLRPRDVFERELTIRAAWGIESTISRALSWLPLVDVDAVVSQMFSLDDAPAAVAAARDGASGKILIRPNPDEA